MHMRGLEFDVTVTLPAGEEGPLSVKQLETRLPSYNQNVANLEESVLFDVISLASVNGRISIQVRSVVINLCPSSNIANLVRHS